MKANLGRLGANGIPGALARLRVISLWELMEHCQQLDRLVDLHSMVCSLGQSLRSEPSPQSKIERARANDLALRLEEYVVQLRTLECHLLAVVAQNALDIFRALPWHGDDAIIAGGDRYTLDSHLATLTNYLSVELGARLFVVLPPNKREYYQQTSPLFGTDVSGQFASAASSEISEAGKCFALSRYTACVFHLMRVMECGINATRKCLGIPDPIKPAERNWGRILERFKVEIDRRNTAKAWSRPSDQEFFAEIYASLDAVRNVWRNATMHVEKTYTEEEAEHILVSVRGFMRKLAARLDEQGHPPA